MTESRGRVLAAGTILQSKYKIVECIGVGASSTVYKAENLPLNQSVAIKVIHEYLLTTEESVKRFFQEAKILSTLNNHGLVKLLAYGADAQVGHFMILEYVAGVTLSEAISSVFSPTSTTEKCIEPELAVRLIASICRTMAEVHRAGFVHRDLKPSNIVLSDPQRLTGAKIIDFGVAFESDTIASSQRLTAPNVAIGSPQYMSPEQCCGKTVDARSDIYSLGCILYELLCGKPPFDEDSAMAVMACHLRTTVEQVPSVRIIPVTLEKIVLKCLEKDPANRFDNISALQTELEEIDWYSTAAHSFRPATSLTRKSSIFILCSLLLSAVIAVAAIKQLNRPVNTNVAKGFQRTTSKLLANDLIVKEKLRHSKEIGHRPTEVLIKYYTSWLNRFAATPKSHESGIAPLEVDTLEAYFSLGNILLPTDNVQAEQYFSKGLQLATIIHSRLSSQTPAPAPAFCTLRSYIIHFCQVLHRDQEGLSFVHEDYNLIKSWKSNDYAADLADCAHRMAGEALEQQRFSDSEKLINEEIAIWETAHDPEHLMLAYTFKAILFGWQNRTTELQKIIEKIEALEEDLGDRPDSRSAAHSQLAALNSHLHNYDRALSEARTAKELAGQDHRSELLSGALAQEVRALVSLNRSDEALALLQKSVSDKQLSAATRQDLLFIFASMSARHERYFPLVKECSDDIFRTLMQQGRINTAFTNYIHICKIYADINQTQHVMTLLGYVWTQLAQLPIDQLEREGNILRETCHLSTSMGNFTQAMTEVEIMLKNPQIANRDVLQIELTQCLSLLLARKQDKGSLKEANRLMDSVQSKAQKLAQVDQERYVAFLSSKAELARLSGDNKLALSVYYQVLELCQDHTKLYQQRMWMMISTEVARLYMEEGNKAYAEKLLIKVGEAGKTSPAALFFPRALALNLLGDLYLSENKPDQAADCYFSVVQSSADLRSAMLERYRAAKHLLGILEKQHDEKRALLARQVINYCQTVLSFPEGS